MKKKNENKGRLEDSFSKKKKGRLEDWNIIEVTSIFHTKKRD